MTDRTNDELADLIGVARETLVSSLLPALPEDQRYDGLMVSNAMAIVVRALSGRNHAGRAAEIDEGTRLFHLLGGTHPDDGDVRHQLARAVRSGSFDAGGSRAMLRADLIRHLHASVAARLRVDNPKALEAAERT